MPLGGGFYMFFILTPWVSDPIWLAHIFQMGGWTNHLRPLFFGKIQVYDSEIS